MKHINIRILQKEASELMNKNMILSLVDKVIKVDRGGPESRVGMVLNAEDDHFTLLTEEDGIIYYNIATCKKFNV